MRIKNSIKNIIFGLGVQVLNTLLAFFTRTIFIRFLGVEYLGIDGLFTNILSMLSLASLGFDSAIIFSLYKPVNDKDYSLIKGYMKLYSKIYKIVALVIFLLGIAIIPFLSKLVKVPSNVNINIYLIYILFLINTSISYLYIYKQSIIIANQKSYIIHRTRSIFIISSNLIQIIFLILFKKYIILLIVQITFKIFENIFISMQANKNFEYLRNNEIQGDLEKEHKIKLYKNVYSMLLYKISGTVINSTDNIVISYFVGIAYVGIYSNYLLIISTIKTFVSYIFNSVVASVGNLIVSNEENKKYFIFKEIQFISFWVYGFCSIAFYVLVNDFINIWIGEKYLLSKVIVIIIVLNFYTEGMQSVSTIYRDTSGLFNVGKYRPIIAAIINLTISVILAPKYGISGVLAGTLISRFSVYFWFDPYVINKYILKKSLFKYFKDYFKYLSIATLSGLITLFFCSFFSNNIFILKLIITTVIPNLIFIIFFYRDEKFIYIKKLFSTLMESKLKIKEK